MITMTAAWYCWALLIGNVFVIGAIVGQWDAFRVVRRRRAAPNGCPAPKETP